MKWLFEQDAMRVHNAVALVSELITVEVYCNNLVECIFIPLISNDFDMWMCMMMMHAQTWHSFHLIGNPYNGILMLTNAHICASNETYNQIFRFSHFLSIWFWCLEYNGNGYLLWEGNRMANETQYKYISHYWCLWNVK